jgi:colicin import membrane protein
VEISIFKDVTQEDIINSLEREGEKYEGLYVDMDNKDERKYVKDKAVDINNLLKKLDRARIDKSKEYKQSVELEAKSIRERLEKANKPFTLLIDEHKEKRAKILAEEKAEQEAKDALIQLQADHELALLMNNEFDRNYESMIAEREKAEQERLVDIERQKDAAAEQARQKEIERHEAARRQEAENKAKRESDIAHISGIRTIAKNSLINLGVEEDAAKKIILAIHNNQIPNITINY